MQKINFQFFEECQYCFPERLNQSAFSSVRAPFSLSPYCTSLLFDLMCASLRYEMISHCYDSHLCDSNVEHSSLPPKRYVLSCLFFSSMDIYFILNFGPYPAVLRFFFLLYTQKVLLVELRGLRMVLGLEPGLAICKVNPLPTVLLLCPLGHVF